MKSMRMYRIYFSEQEVGYILYSKDEKPHVSVLQREIKCLSRENGNHVFRENMNSDLQTTCQSHSFDEHLKLSHSQYKHVALAGFP